jgi:hypothetical protein
MPEIRSSVPATAEATDPLGAVKLLGAWLFVGIPAAWGIFQVVKKSMDLFK